ncbi:MAG: metallophosphoesterase [Christensenellaceae bacterium]
MNKKKKILILSVIILIVLLLILAFRTDIKAVQYDIQSNKIINDTRIALITDLHSCDYGEHQNKLLSIIFNQKPDIILLGGDIVDDKLPQEKAKEFLSAVSEKYPCFYVSGNHEYWSNDISGIKKMIEGYGISILEGDNISFEINGQNITIYGIDDPDIGENEFEKQLKRCANKINEENLSILLTHRPERIDSYLPYGFDLILSGHAHGGQWRIPGIMNGLIAPNQGWFPKYAGGIYEFDHTQMIVSRGLAKESTQVPRIFNRPEVVIINIKPQNNSA